MVPWAHRSSHLQMTISIGSAVFAGLTIMTDRQTDRPRYSTSFSRCGLIITALNDNNPKELKAFNTSRGV